MEQKELKIDPSQERYKEREVPKKIFFRKIRSKLVALAAAGLVTLGFATEGRADQIHFEKKAESAPEIVLEPAITTEKLDKFEEKLRAEEPEFWRWLVQYEKELIAQLDQFASQLLDFDYSKDEQVERELKSKSLPKFRNLYDETFKLDHKVVRYFGKHPDALRYCQDKIKDNVHSIVLGFVLLDQSRTVRDRLVLQKPHAEFVLDPHTDIGINGFTTGEPVEIHQTPKVFLGVDGNVSPEAYVNNVVHELAHAFKSSGTKRITRQDPQSGMKAVLIEGLAQNSTYEIIQYLQSKDSKLKNMLGSRGYDHRVASAVVLDGISKSFGEGDSLARWASGMIDDDGLIKELREAAFFLGIDPQMISELGKFSQGIRNDGQGDDIKFTIDVFAYLNSSGLSLPPEFIEKILTQNRTLNNDQKKAIKRLSEVSSPYITSRTQEIEKIRQ